MKLVYPALQTPIMLSNDCLNSVVIEEPGFFYEIVKDLKEQWEGMDGKAVLSENNEPVEIRKNLELVIDCIDFEINQKTLLTKVLSVLEKVGRSEDYIDKTQQLLADIERYIYDISFDFDVEIQCDKMSIAQILKSVGISIVSGYDKLTEVLYSYMQLVREFDGDKVFAFVNLRSFVKVDELQDFADTVLAHGYRVLLLDNHAYPSLTMEKRLIVDADLCEI
ncbi:MAG: type II-A CRISPR-associated protein Csn2 [Lachnospiraceae bacterium]|nr:type II-A CRISPR-associated protein Csn2 [Lachnospiraceae bacterium]